MLYSFDGKSPRIGDDTYVSEHALVIGDVIIGDKCYIGHGAILRGDYGAITIGPGTAVEEGVIIHAPPNDLCRIEERVTMGHGAIIHAALVGSRSVIGMGAVLSIRSEVGENTIVAEGAVVRMNQVIPSDVVTGGNPAKTIRNMTPKDVEYWAMAKELYINLAKKYCVEGMHPL